VRRKPEAALGQVEPKLVAHRAIEPGVGARLRRPDALDQAAQNHPINRHESGVDGAENPHPHIGFRPAHLAVGDRGFKHLGIIGRLQIDPAACHHLVERRDQLVGQAAERRDRLGVTRSHRGERQRLR
jgi:hypothetical protein